MSDAPSFLTAFLDFDRIASGDAAQVMASVRQRPDAASVFVFDDRTGERLDLDLRPDSSDAAAPAEEAPNPNKDRRSRATTRSAPTWPSCRATSCGG